MVSPPVPVFFANTIGQAPKPGGRRLLVHTGGPAQFFRVVLVHRTLQSEYWFRALRIHSPSAEASGNYRLRQVGGKRLFSQGRREKFTTAIRFANGESEVAPQATLCHVGESAGAKRCRNVLRLFVNRKDQNLRPRVFFAK